MSTKLTDATKVDGQNDVYDVRRTKPEGTPQKRSPTVDPYRRVDMGILEEVCAPFGGDDLEEVAMRRYGTACSCGGVGSHFLFCSHVVRAVREAKNKPWDCYLKPWLTVLRSSGTSWPPALAPPCVHARRVLPNPEPQHPPSS